MNMSQGIAISGIVIAVIMLTALKLLGSRVKAPLNRFLRFSGLIYLSCTVVLYLLIRNFSSITLFYTILTESLALGMHLLSSLMLVIFSKRIQMNADEMIEKHKTEEARTSDVEAE